MFHDQHPNVHVLQQRVEALEAMLARLETRHGRRASRSGGLLPFGITLLPLLAFAGWAIAQQPQAEPLTDLIRKVGDTIQVTAPFQVVDASGRVLLSAAPDMDANAAVSAFLHNGGGGVSTYSASGTPLVSLGSDQDGFGRVGVQDAAGENRVLIGGQGALAVFNQSGKQVAGVAVADSQVGRVSVWGSKGGRIVELTENTQGSGAVFIKNAQDETVAGLNTDENGKGVISISDKGHTAAAIGVNGVGAGNLTLANPAGALALEASGTPQKGASRGGAIKAYNEAGEAVAGLGTTPEGKGLVVIMEKSKGAVNLSTNSSGAGLLLLTDANGQVGLQASGARGSDPSSDSGIVAFDATGNAKVALGVSTQGKGVVTLFDKEHTAAELAVNADGAGALTLNNAEGNSGMSASGAGNESPGGAVMVYNKANDMVASLSSSAEGKGMITVAAKDREVAVLTANDVGAGNLYLYNAEGKVRLNASAQSAAGQDGGLVSAFNGESVAVAILGTSKEGKGYVGIFNRDRSVAEMTASDKGDGRMVLFRSNGTLSLDADGENSSFTTYNAQETLVAGMGLSKEGKGRIAIHGKQADVVELTEGALGHGLMRLKNAQNTVVAGMSGGHNNAGVVSVANSSGKTLSEVSVTEDGRGQFAIWSPGAGSPAALLTHAPDGTGGLLQIYSEKVAVANVKVSSRGGGYIELSDPAGVPTVQAGTAPEGYGLVRVGPNYRCAPGGAAAMALGLPDCIQGKLQ